MADIELVIKIPKEMYKWANDANKIFNDYGTSDFIDLVKHGTPLPKGHGKLFDEKALKKEAIRCEWNRNMYDKLDHTLSYMKPIIDADKASEG